MKGSESFRKISHRRQDGHQRRQRAPSRCSRQILGI